MRRSLSFLVLLCVLIASSPSLADVSVTVGYLRQEADLPPTLSNLDPVPDDLGLAGARVGLADNATTGSFLGQTYEVVEVTVTPGGDVEAAARELLERTGLIIFDGDAQSALTVADMAEAAEALIFNATAQDDELRGSKCRANLLHTIPSYRMRTDALAQFLVRKRWQTIALIEGNQPKDQAFGAAMRKSAGKFGLTIRGEKSWLIDADMRRNAAQEVPLFTQDFGDHDVLVIADELGDFGRYVMFNTWTPRPVAGSEGLSPKAWSRVVEQWGAAQLQKRFRKAAARDMQSEDYGAWAAIRAIGEAVTRTGKADPKSLRTYMLSDDFELAGFKGQSLSFRTWNGQLRQPIPLVHPRALVALAPIEGFLHQNSELDTLGLDEPETTCNAF